MFEQIVMNIKHCLMLTLLFNYGQKDGIQLRT